MFKLKEAAEFRMARITAAFVEVISVSIFLLGCLDTISPVDSIQICDEKGTPLIKDASNFAYQLVSE
jgi:hypothetical protein